MSYWPCSFYMIFKRLVVLPYLYKSTVALICWGISHSSIKVSSGGSCFYFTFSDVVPANPNTAVC